MNCQSVASAWFLNFISLCVSYAVSTEMATLPHPLSDEFINLINSKQNLWTAGRNYPEDTPLEDLYMLTGSYPREKFTDIPLKKHDTKAIGDLPDSFDAREKWPDCPTVGEIRNQGNCATSYAFAATEVMSDRICIFSNSTLKVHLSAKDVLECCFDCNFEYPNKENICHVGGFSDHVWEYYGSNGIVTGGNYDSHEGCKPYPLAPCSECPCPPPPVAPFTHCKRTCEDNYDIPYEKDKHYGKSSYGLYNETQILLEIIHNGPVHSSFMLYEDFYHYKSGIYNKTLSRYIGELHVKILGWGIDNGIKYWLAANSWGKQWGDNGFFKILRGRNHCFIEAHVISGEPQL